VKIVDVGLWQCRGRWWCRLLLCFDNGCHAEHREGHCEHDRSSFHINCIDVRGYQAGHRRQRTEADLFVDKTRVTRTNPKTLCGQKKPPAHMADEMPRHYFQTERTTDRPGCLGWDLSIGHSA
jgi:hypothetical protein